MSIAATLAAVESLADRLGAGEAEPPEVDAVLAAVHAVAVGASREALAELAAAVAKLEAAALVQMDEMSASLRQVGSARTAMNAYGQTIRTFTQGQNVETRG